MEKTKKKNKLNKSQTTTLAKVEKKLTKTHKKTHRNSQRSLLEKSNLAVNITSAVK